MCLQSKPVTVISMLMSDHQHSSILIKASHPCSKRTSPLCASGTMVMTMVKMCLCEWIQTLYMYAHKKGLGHL